MLKLKPLSANEATDSETNALLCATQRRVGFIPNMQGIMANSPAALRLYAFGNELLSGSSLTASERTVVFMAASMANGCDYCVAAHSAGAKVSPGVLQALRVDREIVEDERLETLRRFVKRLVVKRGQLTSEELDDLLAAGYEEKQVLDVLSAVALKTLTNYIGHLIEVPVDEVFMQYIPNALDQNAKSE
ncbi:MAG: carboxymuconolactone decarboxylase family protein [Woeseia sp.]